MATLCANPWARLRSPFDVAAGVLGGRLTAPILWTLFWGGKRFFQILRDLQQVPRRTLAERLLELEHLGLVERRFGRLDKDGVEYALTELGESLKPILASMYHWGLTTAVRADAARLLTACEPTRGPRTEHTRPDEGNPSIEAAGRVPSPFPVIETHD